MNFLTIIQSLDFLSALPVITFHRSNMVGKISLQDISLYQVCTVQIDYGRRDNKMRQVRMFFSLVKLEKKLKQYICTTCLKGLSQDLNS